MRQKTSLPEIVDTAFELFHENGYDNVSVMDICHAVGITKPTFYKFATSKDHLLPEFYRGADESVRQEMAALDLAGDYVEEAWTGTSCITCRSVQLGHDLYSHYVIYCLRSRNHPNTVGHALQADIKDAIRKAQEAGMIRNMTDPDLIWLSLMNMVLGTGCQWAFSSGEGNMLEKCRESFEIILRPVEPKASSGRLDKAQA